MCCDPLRARREILRARSLSVRTLFTFVALSPLTLAPGGVARAATTPPAVQMTLTLGLDQAIERAREVSALVRRARAESRLTGARRVGAAIRLPANPGVAVAVGPQRDESPGAPVRSGLGYRLHVEQAIEIGGQRGARLDEVGRPARARAPVTFRRCWGRRWRRPPPSARPWRRASRTRCARASTPAPPPRSSCGWPRSNAGACTASGSTPNGWPARRWPSCARCWRCRPRPR
jgi:hypothetical protein